MIDLHAARRDPDALRAALARKGAADTFDELLAADRRWRELTPQVDDLRGRTKLKGRPTPEQLEELQRVKNELKPLEQQLAAAEAARGELHDRVPNPPAEDTPDGAAEEDAVVVKQVGEPPVFDFDPRDHLELAVAHGWIDVERAARVSGSRFVYRIGDVALLEIALYRWALARVVAKGHVPGASARARPRGGDVRHGLLPDREVRLLLGARGRPLSRRHLRGAAGGAAHAGGARPAAAPLRGAVDLLPPRSRRCRRDTRGMFRVHQFDKVEMFVFCEPEQSRDEHERLLQIEEELVQELGLPYRVLNIAAGDLGLSAAKKYDIEAWYPGQSRYREITSTLEHDRLPGPPPRHSLPARQARPHVHTLNGTAVTARAMIAILENFQDEDGSVSVPEPLRAFGAPERLGAARAATPS